MANSFLQVRINEEDKERAAEILDGLGTNLSAVVNMLVKQIIITESIPFDIKLNRKADTVWYARPHQASLENAPETDPLSATAPKADSAKDPIKELIRQEYEW